MRPRLLLVFVLLFVVAPLAGADAPRTETRSYTLAGALPPDLDACGGADAMVPWQTVFYFRVSAGAPVCFNNIAYETRVNLSITDALGQPHWGYVRLYDHGQLGGAGYYVCGQASFRTWGYSFLQVYPAVGHVDGLDGVVGSLDCVNGTSLDVAGTVVATFTNDPI